MIRARHILALAALCATGCFLDHGIAPPPPARDGGPSARDGGPSPAHDAGPGAMCSDGEGFVGIGTCPTETFVAGETIELEVWHSWSGCCSSGRGRVLVSRTDAIWTLDSRWEDVCDCCELCDCVGPSEEARVAIGPLVAGVNVVRLARGAAECRIVAEEPSACVDAPASARAARVLFPDQTDDVTLTHVASADCGCAPQVRARELATSLALCDCGTACDDAITHYQGHARGAPRPVGEYVRTLGGAASPLSVRDRSQCSPVAPLGVTVELPDPTAHTAGEPLVWVGVASEVALCCAMPEPAVSAEVAPDGAIDLTVFSCVQADCACVPDAPTPFTAWHSLGPLAAGSYTVIAGEHRARFRVR